MLWAPTDLYLAHHGILGMKWGVRRYQNSDGSLTAAGKARYNRNESEAHSMVPYMPSTRRLPKKVRDDPEYAKALEYERQDQEMEAAFRAKFKGKKEKATLAWVYWSMRDQKASSITLKKDAAIKSLIEKYNDVSYMDVMTDLVNTTSGRK